MSVGSFIGRSWTNAEGGAAVGDDEGSTVNFSVLPHCVFHDLAQFPVE